MGQGSEWTADVLASDGGTVHLRLAQPTDAAAIADHYVRSSDASRTSRFFAHTPPERAASFELAEGLEEGHTLLLAELAGEVVGIARYDLTGPATAEVAFSIRDDQQGRGLGTLMLEYLAAIARQRGIRRFVASALAGNRPMLRVFEDAGFGIERSWEPHIAHVALDLSPSPELAEAVAGREHAAEAASIARIMEPSSVAVIGASSRPGSIGGAVLASVLAGGFTGEVHVVNPAAEQVGGLVAHESIRDVPGRVDVAVIAVPAPAVVEVARECGEAGVHGLVVISAGFGEVPGGADRERELLAVARRAGMRIVGPNCMGYMNATPTVGLNATFAPVPPIPGNVAFASQSGGLGIGLLTNAEELGIGISGFVSMGNKVDVSSNDLIQYWEDDPHTAVILLYLESFGNPRKFGRLARRVSRTKPIVVVKSGRTPAGERGGASHTAALAVPDVAVDALFGQAGVVRVDTLSEMFDVARLLSAQPLPAGRRVAIVSNGGGPAILAADACVANGLEVDELSDSAQETLRGFVSPDGAVANPIDLVASATAETFASAIEVLLADGDIDAVIVIFVAPLVTRTAEVAAAVEAAAAGASKPVLTCYMAPDQPQVASGDASRIPAFRFPEQAARALSHAAVYSQWRRRPLGEVPQPAGVDIEGARGIIAEHLREHREESWLAPERAFELLERFGIPAAMPHRAGDAGEAARLAAEAVFPVVLKAGAEDLAHRSDLGGVRLGLGSPEEVASAYEEMHSLMGDAMGGGLVQPMVGAGVETIVGITHDRSFGPLVLFGMGGTEAELLRDTAVRMAPLTDLDIDTLIRSLRTSPLLLGYRGSQPVDIEALGEVLARVSVMANELVEISEADINPLIVRPDGCVAVDCKIRLEPRDARPETRSMRAWTP